MKSLGVAALVSSMLLFSSAALAERGWACAEDGRIQKYRRVGNILVTEGDAWSEMLTKGNRSVESDEFGALEKWTISLNNSIGLVAISSAAERSSEAGFKTTDASGLPYVYVNAIVINKLTGHFEHTVISVGPRANSPTLKTGSCVEY